MDELIDFKKCKEFYYYTSIVNCIGFQSIWEDCQFKRERKIIGADNLAPVPEEIRRKSNLT